MGFLSSVVSAGASLLGGAMSSNSASNAAESNAKLQKEFAQNGIRWKVADAQAAGIHPLYALGANTHSFAPSHVGDSSMGNAVAEMGQNISRSIDATRNKAERSALDKLTLERAGLENDLLRSQIHASNVAVNKASNPSLPGGVTAIDGQGDSGLVQVNPSERTSRHRENAGAVAGAPQPAAVVVQNIDGSTSTLPAKDVSESLEAGGEIVGGIMSGDWFLRNRVFPPVQRQIGHARKAWSQRWWKPQKLKLYPGIGR